MADRIEINNVLRGAANDEVWDADKTIGATIDWLEGLPNDLEQKDRALFFAAKLTALQERRARKRAAP